MTNKRNIRAWVDWLDRFPLSIRADLTMKKARWEKNKSGEVVRWIKIDENAAKRNTSIWLDRLNGRVYGNAYKRFDKKLDVLTVIEKNKDDKRLHVHALIECPEWMSRDKMVMLIDKCWDRSPWSYVEREITEIDTIRGSLFYNLKNGSDGADLDNTKLARAD